MDLTMFATYFDCCNLAVFGLSARIFEYFLRFVKEILQVWLEPLLRNLMDDLLIVNSRKTGFSCSSGNAGSSWPWCLRASRLIIFDLGVSTPWGSRESGHILVCLGHRSFHTAIRCSLYVLSIPRVPKRPLSYTDISVYVNRYLIENAGYVQQVLENY